MGEPCDKGPAIEAVKLEQHKLLIAQASQNSKIDHILENQLQLGSDIRQAIDGLTRIIIADIETRKDVEQLKKDREILFDMQRADALQIIRINERTARFDGAGIFENFPRMWNWYQQHEAADVADDMTIKILNNKVDTLHNWYLGELGWRRFIPVTLAAISTCLAIYIAISNISGSSVSVSTKYNSTRTETTP